MLERRFTMCHILAEVVIIISVIVYFFKQNSNLEHRISVLENKLNMMASHISMIENRPPVQHVPRTHIQTQVHTKSPKEVQSIKLPTEVPFDDMISLQNFPEDNLDLEIEAELAELSCDELLTKE